MAYHEPDVLAQLGSAAGYIINGTDEKCEKCRARLSMEARAHSALRYFCPRCGASYLVTGHQEVCDVRPILEREC